MDLSSGGPEINLSWRRQVAALPTTRTGRVIRREAGWTTEPMWVLCTFTDVSDVLDITQVTEGPVGCNGSGSSEGR